MPEVRHDQPLTMAWCLDCHRNPGPNVRPIELVTKLSWDPAKDWNVSPLIQNTDSQAAFARKMLNTSNLNPPTNCWTCHR